MADMLKKSDLINKIVDAQFEKEKKDPTAHRDNIKYGTTGIASLDEYDLIDMYHELIGKPVKIAR